MSKLSRKQGFTLMELMIAVTIMAILATIAIPSYQRYVTKSRLEEGKSVLNQHYLWMQNMYNKFNGYYIDRNTPVQTRITKDKLPRLNAKYTFDVEVGYDCQKRHTTEVNKKTVPSGNHFCLMAKPDTGMEKATGGGKECGILAINQAGQTYIAEVKDTPTFISNTTKDGIECFD